MALFLASNPLVFLRQPKIPRFYSFRSPIPSLSISPSPTCPRFPHFRYYTAFSGQDREPDPLSGRIPIGGESDEESVSESSDKSFNEEKVNRFSAGIADEWGEKAEPEVESSYSKLSDADPAKDDDEWGGDEGIKDSNEKYGTESAVNVENVDEISAEIADEWGEKVEAEEDSSYSKISEAVTPKGEQEWERDEGIKDYMSGNGSASLYNKLGDLKRCLVDTVYGTELGFRATSEVRAEALELISQLESSNPTPAPTEAPSLDGNWVLLYTAFSELLPLLAAGSTPFLKIKRISQAINTRNLTIDNIVTLSSPFATFSFSAHATFEVRSRSRIQVQFKEGTLQPPELSSTLQLPGNIEVFGQSIDLSPFQQSLMPLQEAVASISRTISGQPPLKVPIPEGGPSSWLLTTYLDDDLRISRGDGGLFVLAKEGSLFLD